MASANVARLTTVDRTFRFASYAGAPAELTAQDATDIVVDGGVTRCPSRRVENDPVPELEPRRTVLCNPDILLEREQVLSSGCGRDLQTSA